MSAHRFLLAVAALAIGTLSDHAAEPVALTPQARQDFEWFSTLGFPDLKGCPFVRVATGFWWRNQASDDPPQQNIFKAFLLATNNFGFRVFTLDLAENSFTQTNPIANGNTRPGFEVLELSKEVAEVLGAFRNPPAREDESRLFGTLLRSQSEVFTLAWGCWRNGLDSDAQQLYEQVQKMRSRNGGLAAASDTRATLEKDLGMDMYYRGLGSFGNTAVSRPQLLAQLESIVSNYPHSEYAERAKPIADVLRRMVSEDEAHAKLARTDLDQLPVDEQVRELIFRLRDQTGFQSSNPGTCSIFYPFPGEPNTPAHQLLKLGYAAVPQLIAALDDQSFSRSVGLGPASVPNTVLTVGDCAQQILERIAGKTFFVSRISRYPSTAGDEQAQRLDSLLNGMSGASNSLPENGNISTTIRAAESWWAGVQQKGEKQVLIEAVVSAGQDAPAQAEILCQRYPDIAAATIVRGAKAATNSWVHARLVEIVTKLDEPQVTDFLRQEMSSASSPTDRERAASGLRARGKDEEAMRAMLHDWETSGGGMGFLADSDSVPAIQALGRGLRQRPVSTRYQVVRRIGDTNAGSWGGHNRTPCRR